MHSISFLNEIPRPYIYIKYIKLEQKKKKKKKKKWRSLQRNDNLIIDGCLLAIDSGRNPFWLIISFILAFI